MSESRHEVDLSLLRLIADKLVIDITVGHDWPNSQDELLRLQAAKLLRMAAYELGRQRISEGNP